NHAELLAAVAGEQVFAPHDAADTRRQLAQREVARQVPQLVVDILEKVDVKQQKCQRPGVAAGTDQFAVEEFHQVALVVNLGQGIDNGQPVNLFVVLGFDVAAGQEAVNAVANPQIIAVVYQDGAGDRPVVDKRAVGAYQVGDEYAVLRRLNARMLARHRVV